jgi:Ti-type conjugative transfer relaxase TraA
MLSISSRTAGSAASYYIHNQKDGQKEDYYSKEGEGQWQGKGAENLGLTGTVSERDFVALANGFNPKTGEKLAQNAGQKERVAGFDLTFSAPKSVSIAMQVSNPIDAQKIQEAHDKAVTAALLFVQDKQAQTRIGHDGLNTQKTDLTIATFNHQTSREQDPQIHTHSFVFNFGKRENGSFGALDGKPLYDFKMATGAIYRAELASQLKDLGYKIERDGDSFRLQGVSKEADNEFSTRSQQIKNELERTGQSGSKAAEIAALATRKTKEIKDQNELKSMWKEQATVLGIREQDLKTDLHKTPESMLIAPTKESILDGITDNKSLVKEAEIYRKAAIEAQGSLNANDTIAMAETVKKEAIQMQKVGENGKAYGDTKYTNQATIDREKHIVELAKYDKTDNSLKPETVQKALESNAFKLSSEQSKVAFELAQRGSIKVLIGDAGTGKSTTLEVVKNAYERENWQILGAAPTGKAAAGLENGAGIRSDTIHKLHIKLEKGDLVLSDKTVLIIDEAGMVGSKQMESLLTKADAAGSKVILVGDHKQLQSVESGAAFRDIASQVNPSRLEQIHRQKDEKDRAAVQQISKGEAAKAMANYIEKGQVTIEKSYQKAIEAVASKTIQNLDKSGSSIALASTNKQVKDINDNVRNQLKERGELQNSVKIQTEKGKLDLAKNDRILLTKNNEQLNIKNGDLVTVLKVEKDQLTVKIDRTGESKTINTNEYKYIEHGYAVTTHKAQGMTVDNAVVMAGKDTSQELAYVQSSRAKDETTFVFTKDTVNKLTEQTPPTEKMIATAEKIEESRINRGEEKSLPENYKESFKECREYLNNTTYQQNERQLDKNEELLSQLKETLQAMSTSKQNESTQDYKIVEKAENKFEQNNEKVSQTEPVTTIDYKNGDFIQDPKSLPEPKTEAEKEFKTALESKVAEKDNQNYRLEPQQNTIKDTQKEAVDSLTKSHGSPEKAIETAQKIEDRRVERGEQPTLTKEPSQNLDKVKEFLDKNEHKFDKAKEQVENKQARENAGKPRENDQSKSSQNEQKQTKEQVQEKNYERELKYEKDDFSSKK